VSGSTLTAMQAGSIRTVYVVCIQGQKRLLTNWNRVGDLGDAWGAWADFDGAITHIDGLYVEMQNQQTLNPWAPFGGGGSCTLRIVDDANDYLGIEMGRSSEDAGWATELTGTINRSATTINVRDTSSAASSGEAFIGNECFSYSGKTSTSFTGVTRGKYSPFAGEADASRFALHHRVGSFDQYGTLTRPKVTQYRTTWVGAWVGVWEHQLLGDGTISTKADAQLVFAGQIVDYLDVGGATVINLRHVLDTVKETELFTDQYRARIAAGYTLGIGDQFFATDSTNVTSTGVTTQATANTMLVVPASLPPVEPGQIAAGYYTAQGLIDKLNAWLAAEKTAGRLLGLHSFAIVDGFVREYHTFSSYDVQSWNIRATTRAAHFLGSEHQYHFAAAGSYLGDSFEDVYENRPQAHPAFSPIFTSTVDLENESGTFADQAAFCPAAYSDYYETGVELGFFLLDGKTLLAGRIDSGQFVGRLVYELELSLNPVGNPTITGERLDGSELVQIMILGAAWWRILLAIFLSTGTSNYNDARDDLPYGLGLNIPRDLLTQAAFDPSVLSMTEIGVDTTIWIRKQTKLAEILTVDCILRGAMLIWKDESLRFTTWQTPEASLATLVLEEGNKAEAAGSRAKQRAVTTVDASWARPIVEIKFDYDGLSDSYASTVVLEDRGAVDGQSGQAPAHKLAAKNLGFGNAAAEAMTLLAADFFGRWHGFLSRPLHRIRRSIDQRYFEGYAPGDIAVLTDVDARDPATGERGVTARPGMVIYHAYNPGGLTERDGKTSNTDHVGEVDLFVLPSNRATIWSPAAEVDHTYTTGGYTAGYNSGTKTFRCKANVHSEASEAVDASHFAQGDKVKIVEIDPVGAPDSWDREVGGVSGNDITIDTGVSAPTFDTAKRYRIISDTYADAVTTQKTDAYQADDADGMIVNAAPPYKYALPGPGLVGTVIDSEVELDPTAVAGGDGVPFDTGYHLAMVKTTNALMDLKTAHLGPYLETTAMAYFSTGSPTYVLVHCFQRHFGLGTLGLVERLLSVAPFMRSSSGASASVRVTLSQGRPTQATTGDATFAAPYSQVTFTTTSTTWGEAANQELDLRYLDTNGMCWLSIEVTSVAETRGLSYVRELSRT